MRKVVLYIAMSLDGYIADAGHGVGWLRGDGSEPDAPGSYSDFYESVDTVILGWNTYDQIVTELSPDEWPYKEKRSFVFTHRQMDDSEYVAFRNTDVREFIEEIRRLPGKRIWVCGGANIVDQLLRSNSIDVFHIAIVPTILGGGIRLFERLNRKIDLKQTAVSTYNGITEVVYECL